MKSVSRRSFVTLLGTSAASAPILFNTIGSAVASDKTDPARKHIKGVKMALTDEEIAILNGKQGPTMAKVLKSVIAYGDAFEAPYLLDVSNDGHWVTGMGQKGLDALYDLADVLIEGGVKAKRPFTIDPYPMDYENIEYTEEEKKENASLYCHQERWDKQVVKLGLRDGSKKSFSCTCYLPEVGNRPKFGDVLAWAESSAVVYANSVIGARCNRNSGPIEMLCSIAGKTPYFGFLTDEARQATWHIEIKTSKLPTATLLGSAIGMKVGAEVPYITGLDQFLGTYLSEAVDDYLKDFGAATASNGAVGLYHVENITPEAKKLGKKLLTKTAKTFVITDEVLAQTKANYPVLWICGCGYRDCAQYGSKRNGSGLDFGGRRDVASGTCHFYCGSQEGKFCHCNRECGRKQYLQYFLCDGLLCDRIPDARGEYFIFRFRAYAFKYPDSLVFLLYKTDD